MSLGIRTHSYLIDFNKNKEGKWYNLNMQLSKNTLCSVIAYVFLPFKLACKTTICKIRKLWSQNKEFSEEKQVAMIFTFSSLAQVEGSQQNISSSLPFQVTKNVLTFTTCVKSSGFVKPFLLDSKFVKSRSLPGVQFFQGKSFHSHCSRAHKPQPTARC